MLLPIREILVIQMKSLKIPTLFVTGGILYVLLEIIWRSHSHWTMFFLGGLCFVCLGLINEIIPWEMPLWKQVLIGACIVTALEFITGIIVNLTFHWNVWDYSVMPGNILGQICPQYFILWFPVSLMAIVLDDWLRYWWFQEEKPHYRLI